MQKALALLEKNVEWLALALGGLFVLYCAWAYVYMPPATVPVGRQMLGPGEVSEATDKVVKDLKRQIADTAKFEPISVPQVVTAWQKAMGVPTPAPALPAYAFSSTAGNGAVSGIIREGPQGPFQVAVLAQLPAADVQAVQSGLSQVALPAAGPNGNVKPVANAAMDDLAWVTASFVIPAKSLQEAFAAPLAGQPINNPAIAAQLDKLYKTAFLEVQLQRQRATGMLNGQPVFPQGDQDIENVPPPRIQKDDLQPMPDEKANPAAKLGFVEWAQNHFDLITQPKFYDVKAGDIWNAPNGAPKQPAPGGFLPGARPPVANPPPLAANPNLGAAPNVNNPGAINPLSITSDFIIWAHDESARAGETYRYRVIYHMKNPVVTEQGIGAPKIIDVLDIASPPSPWSTPVAIAQKTKFWVANVNRNGTVQMDIFQYSQGQWQKTSTPQLSPGDPVPQTDWAVVDVHSGTGAMRDKYVLLADADGDIAKHSAGDRNDPKYKEMLDLVNPKTPPPGPGGAPGVAPGQQPPPPRRTAAARGG